MVTDSHPPIRMASEPWKQPGVLTDEQYDLIRPIVFFRMANPTTLNGYARQHDIVLELCVRRNQACALDLRNRQELR